MEPIPKSCLVRTDSFAIPPMELTTVVEEICAASECLAERRGDRGCRHVLPSRSEMVSVVEDLRSVLFPGYFGTAEISAETMRFHVGSTLDRALRTLQEQVQRGICFRCEQDQPDCPQCKNRSGETTAAFLARLPRIRELLATDVQAAYEGDPAASSPDEAIFCYPGVRAITDYRIAHELHSLEVPLLPRIITEYAHGETGIDIHPGASIGPHFFIDHGTGIVIGETTVIGARVRIYQGVTLGAKSFPLDGQGKPIKGIPRHPVVEDDVIIYGGATILGRVTIGRGSVIGGNVWLTHGVPPGSRIIQAQASQEVFQGGAGI